jgi:general secretion pathway protein J
MCRNDGFTLIELLIALFLLVLLSGALYGTYFSVLRGSSTARERYEPIRDAGVTLDLLRRELSATFYSKGNTRLHFVVEDRDVFGKPASTLDFTTFTVPQPGSAPSSDVMVARYQPVEQEGDQLILARDTRDIFIDTKPVFYPLTGQIEGFLVECYDGSKWVKSWDTSLNGTLPKAVRVTLYLHGDDEDKPESFTAITVPQVKGS